MPTFLPADLSPVLLCTVTVIVSVLAGMMPCSPFEPMLVAVAAVARPSLLIPLAVLATVSQMAAKTLIYLGSRKAERSLSARKRAVFERVRARLAGRRGLQVATILVSGVFGLPPFYIVTVACGALRLPLRDYVIAGTFGRAIRFAAIMMLPQFFALAAGPTPLLAQKGQDPAAVFEAGRGPETYVLLTGVVGGVAGFRRLDMRLLEQGYRVIVIDPFHLSLDSADVSFAAMARRVDAILRARGVTSARMVGHSHGGGVLLRVAAMAPERVTALYLLDVGALASARTERLSASVRLAPIIALVPGGRRLIRERLLKGLRQNTGRHEWLDAETQRAYTEPMLNGIGRVVAMAIRLCEAREPESLASLVSRIHVPVTVILGDLPHPSQPGLAELEALAPLGALLRIERLPGVAHFPHEEAPDDVARLLLPPLRIVARAADGGR